MVGVWPKLHLWLDFWETSCWPGSTSWIHQDPPYGSTNSHHVDPRGFIRIRHWDPPGSPTTTRIHLGTPFELTRFTTGTQQDPTHESTKSHLMDQAGSTPGFHQDPSHGSTRIHQVDPPGSIMWIDQYPLRGSTSIHHMDPPWSTIGIHQDSSHGSITWIHQDPSRSLSRIHKNPSHQDPSCGPTSVYQDPQMVWRRSKRDQVIAT